MAHFAELNTNNVVLRVIVVGNNMILNADGQESETVGVAFCHSLFGSDTIWAQTSYNGNFRKNYASIGYTYDSVRNAFISPKPEGDYWVLNEDTCQWYDPNAAAANTNMGVSRV